MAEDDLAPSLLSLTNDSDKEDLNFGGRNIAMAFHTVHSPIYCGTHRPQTSLLDSTK